MIRPARRVERLERSLLRRIFESAPPDAINLGLGQPDLQTPGPICDAGIRGIEQGHTGYTATAGDPELRALLARHYAPFASTVDDVVVTVGSQEALFACCTALLDPDDELLCPDPGYPAYPVLASLLGARARPYPLRPAAGFRLKAQDVLDRIGPRSRAVILCAPSNPTGALIEREELVRLVEGLEAAGVPWISDEVYAAFDYTGEFVSPSKLHPDGGLVVSSLSKELCMTGWRVGWVVGRGEIMRKIASVHQYAATCSPSISQRAALAAFGAEGRAERERIVARFRRRRELMAAELERIPGLRCAPPEGAFYFFVDVSNYGSAEMLARRILQERNVIVIPGVAFGGEAPDFLRISFAASEEAIREGIRRIGAELAAVGHRER